MFVLRRRIKLRTGVPFVPTPEPVAQRMLQLCSLRSGETVCDLGSGDGRIPIIAARDFGAKAFGIEMRGDLVQKSRTKVQELGLGKSVEIIKGNFFDIDISDVDVVTLFLLTGVNTELKPKLEIELKASARVVTHDYEIPGWKPAKKERVEWKRVHSVFVYRCCDISERGLLRRVMKTLLTVERVCFRSKIGGHRAKLAHKICHIYRLHP